ncbi:urease accessory protein UreE [Halomonas koreensis]|uniref:Urease accessory protein UreE n=1 Tax=Halomonas koreensis TaxID=245385 RepID=A0ABU1G1Z3_9GAMM|nr:urease accessory protein UreE [Halomonas koreensis]MDR5866965.1 urease accessory protein UreE [Halomonas koreensis]
MWKLNQRLGPIEASAAVDTLTLDYATRTRGRFKASSDGGRELGIFLDRGPVLRHGDGLTGEDGQTIRVQAAVEPVVTARLESGLPLARLSYHLGNRHVQLAIGADADAGSTGLGWVRFPPDHVLEALAERLGARLERHEAPFDPEPGAYARAGEGGHHHHHGHHHGHDHAH